MRIIPYELMIYAPDMSLSALRKEISMYDYCLNKNMSNIAMQPFLDLGRNYFNIVINEWVLEMTRRNLYVNTFQTDYVKNNPVLKTSATNIFLIIECCLQWDLKSFTSYQSTNSWFSIITHFIKQSKSVFLNWNPVVYEEIKQWYHQKFMKKNSQGKWKPYKLNMTTVIEFLNKKLVPSANEGTN